MPNDPTSEPYIVAAAVTLQGMIFTLPRPNRHHNILNLMFTLGVPKRAPDGTYQDQGFLTSDGKFVDRIEGARIAKANGQITPEKLAEMRPPNLYTEDLW